MSEKVTVCIFDEPLREYPMDRDDFYSKQMDMEDSEITEAVSVIDIFLFNEHGEIFVQKRSDGKTNNPGLEDKSVGGHIQWGDTADYTVMIETVQELQVPSLVLRNKEDFLKTYKLLNNYINTVAIVLHIDTELYKLKKLHNGRLTTAGNKKNLYFGVYTGPIKTVDREAKGILQYSLDELNTEIEKFPDKFTEDIKHYTKVYQNELKDFVSLINKK